MEYVEGQNEYIPIRPEVKKNIDQMYAQADSALENGNPEAMNELKEQFGENPYELKNILKYWVRSDKEGLRVIPTDSIVMKIDKEAVRRSGMKIPEALGDSIPEYMTILLRDANGNPKRALYKSELMMLEMLANANWERPIYMAITVGSENHLGMDNHFTQEQQDRQRKDVRQPDEQVQVRRHRETGHLHRRKRNAYVLHTPAHLHTARRTAHQGRQKRQGTRRTRLRREDDPVIQRTV